MRKLVFPFSLRPGRSTRGLVLASAGLLFSLGASSVFGASQPEAVRICADPNNLPFSNREEKGFENAIARLLAKELKAPLSYTWWAQRRGFFRNTLKAGLCDVVLGAPVGLDAASTTRPYYRSSYVFVTRADRSLRIRSLDDPRLHTLKIGVQVVGDDYANTPPVHALSERGIADNVVGYSVVGDYSTQSPPSAVVEAVHSGAVDVAIVWGPLAGYFARRFEPPLELTSISESATASGIPLRFEIGMAVRRGDHERKQQLESFLVHHWREIDAILEQYGVPRQ